MGTRVEVYAGTAGHSAWFSDDRGLTWVHPNSHSGMYLEARVWAFSSHPDAPDELYAGTDMGLFRWNERSTRWTAVASPMQDIWALAQDPRDHRVLYAGTRPAGFFRSPDQGQTWQPLEVAGIASFSEINMGPTRVTRLMLQRGRPDVLWASVEIGGIYCSEDGGQTWSPRTNGLVSMDVHDLASILDADGNTVLFATTNRGLHRSDDLGENWVFQRLDSPWQYTRAIVARADTDSVLFLANGNGPPGSSGALLRSDDYGRSWKSLALPGQLQSTVWCIAVHESDPKLILVATNLGQLFRSEDGGQSWHMLPHQFGEVRALCWRTIHVDPGRPAHSITVRRDISGAELAFNAGETV